MCNLQDLFTVQPDDHLMKHDVDVLTRSSTTQKVGMFSLRGMIYLTTVTGGSDEDRHDRYDFSSTSIQPITYQDYRQLQESVGLVRYTRQSPLHRCLAVLISVL